MNPLQLSRQLLGKTGEDLAVTYLQKHGYTIIERNFKARYGELDVVVIKENTLIIIEVKTRVGKQFGKPEEAITYQKLKELIKTSQYYSLLHPELPHALRLDLIAISLNDDTSIEYLKHIQNITS